MKTALMQGMIFGIPSKLKPLDYKKKIVNEAIKELKANNRTTHGSFKRFRSHNDCETLTLIRTGEPLRFLFRFFFVPLPNSARLKAHTR